MLVIEIIAIICQSKLDVLLIYNRRIFSLQFCYWIFLKSKFTILIVLYFRNSGVLGHHLKSPESRLFVQKLAQANNKENSNCPVSQKVKNELYPCHDVNMRVMISSCNIGWEYRSNILAMTWWHNITKTSKHRLYSLDVPYNLHNVFSRSVLSFRVYVISSDSIRVT